MIKEKTGVYEMTISFTTSFFRKSLMSWTNSLLRRFKSSLREALFSEMNNLSPCRRTFSVYFTTPIHCKSWPYLHKKQYKGSDIFLKKHKKKKKIY